MKTTVEAKPKTPGYKSVLISEESFVSLQAIQKASGVPMRLSVADLADAAIALQLSTQSDAIIQKAREIVIHSLNKR
jgi:hypothetical protein